jgi:hypothetical protein
VSNYQLRLKRIITATVDEDPDKSLPYHARFQFANGEARILHPLVKPRELLATGQTQAEADDATRKVKAMLLRGAGQQVANSRTEPTTWFTLWEQSIDASEAAN